MRCIVPNCSNFFGSDNNKECITFHKFPHLNYRQWLRCIGLKENIPYPKWMNICSLHFTEDCFVRTEYTVRLKPNAMPTISLPMGNGKGGQPTTKSSEKQIRKRFQQGTDQPERNIRDPRLSQASLLRTYLQEGAGHASQGQNIKISNVYSTCGSNDDTFEDTSSNNLFIDRLEFLTVVEDVEDVEETELSHIDEVPQKRPLEVMFPENVILNKISATGQSVNNEMNRRNKLATIKDSKTAAKSDNSLLDEKILKDGSSDDKERVGENNGEFCYVYKKNISKLQDQISTLENKNQYLTERVEALTTLLQYLKDNNFLNKYANAVIQAVLTDNAETTHEEISSPRKKT